ncbi:MAG: ABC transporter permease [Acidobacteria bacterium]|nr:ABC transporter permease [Acidobacteriota bacterium]
MARLRESIYRLWGTLRGNPRDAEMEEELKLHLELATEDMQRRMGATDEAVRVAHLRAGGITQAMEARRDQRGLPWLADLAQDMRHGFRTMRRNPGFTTVACVTLALGIGANTAIFSLVNVLVWRDLPVRDPGSLVQFTWQYPGDPPLNRFSTQNYEQYRDRNDVFSDLIGTAPVSLDAGPEAQPLNTEWVTGNFFTALGVRPALGRLLELSDGAPGAAPVAVVSWPYWENRFNLDPRILGTQISVADVPAQVVGVTRQEFSGLLTGYRTDVWIPAAAHPKSRQGGFMLMARLKEGVSLGRAHAQMRVLDRPRIEEFARKDPQWLKVTLEVEPARSGFSTPLHQQFGKPLLVVMAIVGALLLLTCANIGSMLLARAAARQREMAVRVSLGASRFRIVRQVQTESLLLSLAGSLFGVVGAYFGAHVLVRIMTSGTRLIGAPPRTGQLRSGRLFGSGLVVAQVALSLVLLSVAGLYVRHLSNLRNRDVGFDRTSVLLVRLDTGRAPYEREQLAQLYKELLERFESVPGVRSATLSGMTPISGAAGSRFVTIEGFEEAPTARRRVMLNNVAPKYFETFGTSLISGRDFQFPDEGRARAVIVNEAMARHYFADRDPLGRQLLLEGDSRPYEVVGVVADAKYADLRSPVPPTVYLDAFQQNRLPSVFALRTSVPPTAITTDVRRTVQDVLEGVSVTKMATLTEQVDASIVPERLIATLAGFFGGVSVLLAALGLYGLLAYTVARRTNEIGIRIALGASRRDVTQMVLRQALSLVCVGLIIGTPIAIWSRRIAVSVLQSMSAESLLPNVVAAVVTIGVALLAAYLPARRATRVEPLIALRSE